MRKPNAKERILETAGELFFQRGYSAVGINEIIEKAGTAKASFYQHYPSKESLCEAWLKAIHQRSLERQESLLARDTTPDQKLGAYFDMLGQFLTESDFRGCPYSNTSAVLDVNCPKIVDLIRVHKEATRCFLRKITALAFDFTERAEIIGDCIFLLYSGATTEAQNLRDIWPVTVAKTIALELMKK